MAESNHEETKSSLATLNRYRLCKFTEKVQQSSRSHRQLIDKRRYDLKPQSPIALSHGFPCDLASQGKLHTGFDALLINREDLRDSEQHRHSGQSRPRRC